MILAGTACTGGAESATAGDQQWSGSSFGLPELAPSETTGADVGPNELAFTDSARILPPVGPGGAPFTGCLIDYRTMDWDADSRTIVEAHADASTVPCTDATWYRDTAFQNGILTFMVLVGQGALAGAGPTSDQVDAVASSLRDQGFDRLATMEVAASGRCDQGGVQAALFTLTDSATVDGLTSMVESAAASGATVERTSRFTTITGAGAPCATAIIHNDRTLGWVTAADRAGLDTVLSRLAYT